MKRMHQHASSGTITPSGSTRALECGPQGRVYYLAAMSRRLFAIILMIWSSIHKGFAFRPIVARGLFHRTVTRLSQSSEDIGLLRVPELKDRLRAAGLPVSGRKTELIERLQRGSSVAQLFAAPSAARSDVDADPLPTIVGPAVLIAACKS